MIKYIDRIFVLSSPNLKHIKNINLKIKKYLWSQESHNSKVLNQAIDLATIDILL